MEEYEIEQMKAQAEKLDTYLNIHDELIDRCEEWLDEFVYMGRDLYDITIKVNNEAYTPYVLVDYMYRNESHFDGEGQEKIPLSIFWDYECVAKEKKKRYDKQMEDMKQREEKKKVQDMKDKAQRYEQYLDLCKEFEESG